MNNYFVSGIQQIGLGNASVYDTWEWYRKHLHMNIPIFDEAAEAKLMLPYTGGVPRSRHAVLAMNMGGGAGLEIWQYTSRVPQAADFKISFNDYGILCPKFKTPDITKTYQYFVSQKLNVINDISSNPTGALHFYAYDPYHNLIEIIEDDSFYDLGNNTNAGICGVTLGVQNLEKALILCQELLGYDQILSDNTGKFTDIENFTNGDQEYRRIQLTHSKDRKGPFSQLLGKTYIELISGGGNGKRIFENRLWGDLGYIHLCFDVVNMDKLKEKSISLGYPFTVDTDNSFDMGEAAGRFAYIETAEGILIEFVETHKIPILKKLGLYLNLKNRDREKPLPRLILKGLGLNKKSKTVNLKS